MNVELANTPEPPYYVVVFTSVLGNISDQELLKYTQMSNILVELASKETGFIGMESVRNELGITVSYWESLESIRKWKSNVVHAKAQRLGETKWYGTYKIRIAKVDKEITFSRNHL